MLEKEAKKKTKKRQNRPQIQPFLHRFRKRWFTENPYETLAVRRKIKVRTSKIN